MVKKMNENNELILLLYDNTNMGVNSTKELLKLLKNKDNKIKFILEEQLQRYEYYLKIVKKLMKTNKIKSKHNKILAYVMSTSSMKMEVNNDNNDSKIANILIRGFTMGNIDIESKIKNYKKKTNKEIIKLANDIKLFGEKQIELLKEYL